MENEYSRKLAEVIMNIMGNVISGQVNGDTAKFLSEKFGLILQDKESISINASDTSVSRSKQLEQAVPASVISSLSFGEFVGIVADNPDTEIGLKAFKCKAINDHKALAKRASAYQQIPAFKTVNNDRVQKNFQQVKQDVQNIVDSEREAILNVPVKKHLIVHIITTRH